MDFSNGIAGGVAGLASGGPWGGVAGAIGGLFGNNNGREESGVKPRAWTENERKMLQQLYPGIAQLLQGMNPQQQQAMYDRLFQAAYDPAAKAINKTFIEGGAKQDSANLLRGTGPSSTMVNAQQQRLGQQAGALSDASNQAGLIAQQGVNQQQQINNQSLANLAGIMSDMKQGRYTGATQYSQIPGQGLTDAVAGIGSAIGDSNSWWNQRSSGANTLDGSKGILS